MADRPRWWKSGSVYSEFRNCIDNMFFLKPSEHDADDSVVARIVGCSFDERVLLDRFYQYVGEDTVLPETTPIANANRSTPAAKKEEVTATPPFSSPI